MAVVPSIAGPLVGQERECSSLQGPKSKLADLFSARGR